MSQPPKIGKTWSSNYWIVTELSEAIMHSLQLVSIQHLENKFKDLREEKVTAGFMSISSHATNNPHFEASLFFPFNSEAWRFVFFILLS